MLAKKKVASVTLIVAPLLCVITLNFLGLCWSGMRFVSEREYIAAALSREWKILADAAVNRGLSEKPRTLDEFLGANNVYANLHLHKITHRELLYGDTLPYTPPHRFCAGLVFIGWLLAWL